MGSEDKIYKIVLVDDDKNFCDLFVTILQKEGLQIECYYDPDSFLKEIKNKEIPDLILLDIALPKINGFNVLNYLKKEFKDKCPKILLITNLEYTDKGEKIDSYLAKSMGADDIIFKTESLEEILKKMKNYL